MRSDSGSRTWARAHIRGLMSSTSGRPLAVVTTALRGGAVAAPVRREAINSDHFATESSCHLLKNGEPGGASAASSAVLVAMIGEHDQRVPAGHEHIIEAVAEPVEKILAPPRSVTLIFGKPSEEGGIAQNADRTAHRRLARKGRRDETSTRSST